LAMVEISLPHLLHEYRKHLSESGLSDLTIKNYVSDIRHFASWLSAAQAKSLLESTVENIREYCLQLAREKAHPPATVNRRVQSIRKFYRYAADRGLVEKDPSAEVKLMPQRRSQTVRGLSQPEIERLLAAVRKGPPRLVRRDYAIVQVMLQTGIRVGELTSLQLSDISLLGDKAVLKVGGQGARPDREVPLNASVRKAISAYLQERPPGKTNRLFLSRKGNPLSVRSVQRLVTAYGQAAGLDKTSTYTLRQTCGQHMLRDTGDLSLVARLLGHKRLETAIRYILPGQEDLAEVAERSSLNVY
jgi:site-specific recombinase XerD